MTDKRMTRRRNAKYAAMQGIYWMISCICVVFTSVFLLDRGYSNSEIGVILALGYILGMVLQPIVSSMADRSARLTPTAFLAIISAVVALLAGGMLLIVRKGIALSILYVFYIASQLLLLPLVNAYCYYLETPQSPIRFGLARGTGSLIWGLTSFGVGFLVEDFGVMMLPYAQIFAVALMLILLYLCHLEGPSALQERKKAEPNAQSQLRLSTLLGRYLPFFFVLIGNALIFFGHSQVDNYPYQIITNVGGNAKDLGIFCGYAALLEIPGMVLFERINKRYSCEKLLCFGAFFFAVKGLLFFFATSLAGVYLSNMVQMISFAIFVPASVRYAGDKTDPCDTNKAQSLVTATTTAGNVLSSAFGGFLLDTVAVRGMLQVGFAAAAAGALFVFLGVGKKEKK